MEGALILWFALAIFLCIVEAMTFGLICIWFAVGAFAAAFSASMGVNDFWWQVAIFSIVSAIMLILTKPLVRKLRQQKPLETSVEKLAGATGMVTERIDSVEGTGQVKIGGIVWTARCEDIVEKGEKVIVERIEGVKVIVKKKE